MTKNILGVLRLSPSFSSILAGYLLLHSPCAFGVVDQFESRPDRDQYAIRLKARTFVPEPGLEPGVADYVRRHARAERVHLLAQFHRIPDLAARDVLVRELKVRVLDPVPERAFFISLPPDRALPARLLDRDRLVRWIGVIRPDDKLAPWLKKGIPAHARPAAGQAEVIVQFFGDVPIQQQQRVLRTHGARLLTRINPLNGWRVSLAESAIFRLITNDEVKWVEEIPEPPEIDNDGVRSATGVNAEAVQPPALFNLTGAGVVLAQWEPNHASLAHGDFTGRIVLADPPLLARDRNGLHNESVTVNGQYDVGEGIYRDDDDSFTVSAGDLRLTAVGLFAAGSTVAAADADAVAANPLVIFSALERFADNVTVNGAYSPGEGLYLDADGSLAVFCGTVTVGDTRLTAVGAFAAGSVVAAADADVGQAICRFSLNAHSHPTHVAGTLMGSGAQSMAQGGTANQWKGVASAATLRSYAGNPTSGTGAPVPADEYTDAAANTAAISSNSWGTTHCHQRIPPQTCYDVGSQYYDAVISGRRSDGTASGIARQLLIFGSAGNRGVPERHAEDVAVNALYDNGEDIYRDLDDSGTVSAGDQRRTAVGAFAAGSVVVAADADAGTALINFNLNEAHDDTVSLNFSGSWTYDSGEGIYLDSDLSLTASVGETRITPVGGFAAGSIVAAADPDAGRNLRRFNLWRNVRLPNSAKDTIEVANVTSDAINLSVSSSRGPTDDGRVKPDLAAPGDQNGGDGGVTSAGPGNIYFVSTGTSMATPAAAGSAGLLEEWYRTACAAGGALPGTLKALMLHGADDLTNIPSVGTAYSGPDFAFGYGRGRVKEAVELVPYQRQGSAAALGDTDYSVTVGMVGKLKVTLVWDDPPWTANAAPSVATGILQNDLDLVLIAPDGTQYTPWEVNGSNPFAVASRTSTPAATPIPASARDRRNPVEQVVVDNAAAGTWTIRVTASTLNLPSQGYTLVSEAFPAGGPCIATPAADLWLMDTPADTGTVPSSGNQWEGPDPWNRLAADGLTTHQNPEFGQTNHLYATLRNASAVTARSTTLDFWIANSSVGLVWPDNFQFVGRLTAPNMTASEVRQVGPLPWSPPSPTPWPHHCMYVRVQSPQDPITFSEVASVWTNSISSNNIVYRNLDIVDLLSSRTVPVLLRNIEKRAAEVDLLIEIPPEFLRRGEVLLGLSPALEKSWPADKRKVDGLRPPDDRYRVVVPPPKEPGEPPEERIQAPPYRVVAPKVVLRGFRMGPGQAEPIYLTFRSNDRSKATYSVHLSGQIEGRTFGGFEFVVRTGNR